MTKLDELVLWTERLVDRVHDVDADEFIELIEFRDKVIQELTGLSVITAADQQKIRKIQSYHSLLVNRMIEIRDEAREGLDRINQSRIQKKSYEAYAPVSALFFDKKK